jgi:hypothetical protein
MAVANCRRGSLMIVCTFVGLQQCRVLRLARFLLGSLQVPLEVLRSGLRGIELDGSRRMRWERARGDAPTTHGVRVHEIGICKWGVRAYFRGDRLYSGLVLVPSGLFWLQASVIAGFNTCFAASFCIVVACGLVQPWESILEQSQCAACSHLRNGVSHMSVCSTIELDDRGV